LTTLLVSDKIVTCVKEKPPQVVSVIMVIVPWRKSKIVSPEEVLMGASQ
jgi:hypothetical protein